MRKFAAALLAVPVIVLIYVPVLLRRSVAARVGLGLGVGTMLGLAAMSVVAPPRSAAILPRQAEPVASARFTTDLRVHQSPSAPITIDFSAPMDEASVASALSVDPPAVVSLAWNADRTHLVVRPTAGWDPATYYTVTVGTAARDDAGAALESPVRAAFFSRPATVGRISTDSSAGEPVTPDTAFVVAFDRPVDVASLASAITVDPPVSGSVESDPYETTADRVRFVPAQPLRAGTTYTVRLDGPLTDANGAPLAAVPALTVTTVEAPGIVRFRPLAGAAEVAPDAPVSVRFTQPMDHRSTAAAFSVIVNGTPVAGRVRWAEKDTVLVFDPVKAFPPGATVVAAVSDKATSRDGVAVGQAKKGTFKVEKPTPVVKPKPVVKPTPVTIPKPGTGGVSGSWRAVETYYLKLMNCTRQGGWVTASGACSSPGGRNVAPLVLDSGISSRVARPYAKRLATSGICNHFSGGNPGTRLRRAGYDSYRWAENLGCRSAANAFLSVLGTHRFYQSEKPYRGGHYVNLMNPAYTRVGIGVWVSGGRVRLVVDFYRP